jgi:hypothetical protein
MREIRTLRLTWRELETWLWLPDCGPARKCWNHHRGLRRARQFSTLPMSGMWKRGHGTPSEAPPDERGGNR